MKLGVEWKEGELAGLEKDFYKLSIGVQEECKKTLRDAGKEVRDKAKRRVQVKTGALKKSIKFKMRSKAGTGEIKVNVFADYPDTDRRTKSSTSKQKAGARVYYAMAIEYGRKAKGTDKRKSYPFLIPASREVEAVLPKRIENVVSKEIGKL